MRESQKYAPGLCLLSKWKRIRWFCYALCLETESGICWPLVLKTVCILCCFRILSPCHMSRSLSAQEKNSLCFSLSLGIAYFAQMNEMLKGWHQSSNTDTFLCTSQTCTNLVLSFIVHLQNSTSWHGRSSNSGAAASLFRLIFFMVM